MADLRATLKSVRVKPGNADDARPSVEILIVSQNVAGAKELLDFVGHDVAASIDPIDQLLYQASRATPLEEAIDHDQAPANGSVVAAPATPRRGRPRRVPAASNEGP